MEGFFHGADLFDLTSLPAAVVAVTAFFAVIPIPRPFKPILQTLKSPVQPFITVAEAEALLVPDGKGEPARVPKTTSLWFNGALALVALLETLLWIVIGSYLCVVDEVDAPSSVVPFLIAVSWLYACASSIFKPTATAPYTLLVLYLSRIAVDSVVLGGVVYDNYVYGVPVPNTLYTVALSASLAGAVVSLIVVMGMPVGIPTANVNPAEIVRPSFAYAWLTR